MYLQERRDEPRTLAAIGERFSVPAQAREPAFTHPERTGHLRRSSGQWTLTRSGWTEFEKLAAAWKDWPAERLDDWGSGPEPDTALGRVAGRLHDQGVDDPVGAQHAPA